MKILKSLSLVSDLLAASGGEWAICGGIAACIYRDTPRYTGDIDIALSTSVLPSPEDKAREVARELGYDPIAGFLTDQFGSLLPGVSLIVGRESKTSGYVGIDFLLPVLPWVEGAVSRAQTNLLDFGFARLPTIRPEDLIVAKLYAFQGTPARTTDLDDVRSILGHFEPLDKNFISKRLDELTISLPRELAAFFTV
jgi:hypothetical protein